MYTYIYACIRIRVVKCVVSKCETPVRHLPNDKLREEQKTMEEEHICQYYICIFTHAHTYTCIRMYLHTYVFICIHIYKHVWGRSAAHMPTSYAKSRRQQTRYRCRHIHMDTHKLIHICMYICTYMHTYVCMWGWNVRHVPTSCAKSTWNRGGTYTCIQL